MNQQENLDNVDSFEELFAGIESMPQGRPDLADSIFRQTRGVLFRRRLLRRSRLVLALAGCYFIGVYSGWVLKPATIPASTVVQMAVQPQQSQHNSPKTPSIAGKNSSLPISPPDLLHPLPDQPDRILNPRPHNSSTKGSSDSLINEPRLANMASPRSDTSSFENLRRAGDRQLLERGNIRSAIEFYRRALTCATEDELRVEIHRDSWLLMSLKQSRIEELKHARQKRV